jgi:N-acetyl sugar amidotransferase
VSHQLTARYGLPEEVKFCTRCVLSNQRPSSYPEFLHTPARKTPTLHFDEEGVCDACRYAEKKEAIDWEERERQLLALLDRFRKNDGSYDCLVPGSGGKDSAMAAHLLKYKYGMHPLTVTWPPLLYTDYGRRNFLSWIEEGGFDNITFKPNGRVHKLLTRLSLENLLHPFQTFMLGQKNLAPKMALKFNIPLVFYGESEAEYGNPIAETTSSLREKSYYTMSNLSRLSLGGVPVARLMDEYGLTLGDLQPYLPPDHEAVEKASLEVHYLGYYVRWTPQEAFYYAVEHTGFMPRPFRSEGTYSKYNSIDDKVDDLHYYTTFIKFGLGRASYDASQEIRNKHLRREEAVRLVRQYDGEFPSRYLDEVLEFLELGKDRFIELCDSFRSEHLWKKEQGQWTLRHQVE